MLQDGMINDLYFGKFCLTIVGLSYFALLSLCYYGGLESIVLLAGVIVAARFTIRINSTYFIVWSNYM